MNLFSRRNFFSAALFVFVMILHIPQNQNLQAWEYGVTFSNNFRYENKAAAKKNSNDIYESARISAWLSFNPLQKTSFYLKAGVGVKNETILSDAGNFIIAPELESARLSVFPADAFFAEIGRIPYADILSISADNTFDGATINFMGNIHGLSASVLYTGLLYKETANVFLSDGDEADFYKGGYFAAPHLLLTLSYHFKPNFKNSLDGSRFSAEFIREMDVREGAVSNNIFFLGRAALVFNENLSLNTGGSFFIGQENDDSLMGAAALATLAGKLKEPLPAELALDVRVFWGAFGKNEPFTQINRMPLGLIYDPVPARIIRAAVDYTASLTRALSFYTGLALFARLDADYMPEFWAYDEYSNIEYSESFLLGEEFKAGVLWTPFSDLSFNLGAVFFFPDSGPQSVYIKNTPMKWDIRLGLLMSF